MRVNARLDEESQQQVQYITQATGHSVSHVVREALAQYYVHVRQSQQRVPSKFLAMAGKGNSGRSDIASNVKAFVGEALEAKFALSHPLPKPLVKANDRRR